MPESGAHAASGSSISSLGLEMTTAGGQTTWDGQAVALLHAGKAARELANCCGADRAAIP
jgi:hypothetical protein